MNALERKKLAEIPDKRYICYIELHRVRYLEKDGESYYWRDKKQGTRFSMSEITLIKEKLISWHYDMSKIKIV